MNWTYALICFSRLTSLFIVKNGQIYWNHFYEFSLNIMDMYMFYFIIFSRFDFNMAMTNTPMTTAKKSNKRQSL